MPRLNSFIKLIDALEISADYLLHHELFSGWSYICDELTVKLKNLTPRQRKTVADIIDAYLQNLGRTDTIAQCHNISTSLRTGSE